MTRAWPWVIDIPHIGIAQHAYGRMAHKFVHYIVACAGNFIHSQIKVIKKNRGQPTYTYIYTVQRKQKSYTGSK